MGGKIKIAIGGKEKEETAGRSARSSTRRLITPFQTSHRFSLHKSSSAWLHGQAWAWAEPVFDRGYERVDALGGNTIGYLAA